MPFSAAATASSNVLSLREPPIQASSAADVQAVRFAINLAVGDVVNGTAGAVGILPAGHVPVAVEVDSTVIDSHASPTMTYSLGILNAGLTALSTAAADGGAAWATGLTTGRNAVAAASGIIPSRPLKTVQQSQSDRFVGIIFTAAVATAAAGTFSITLYYRAA